MKKIILLVNILLLMAVAVKAQTPQYSISASAITAISSGIPFNSHPAGSRAQFVYLSSNFPGTTPGFITKIYFKAFTSATNATYSNFVIKMGETTATTLTTGPFITAGMNTVFTAVSHVIPTVTAGDWVEFVLPTPLPYDNTKNFIVEVAHDAFSNGFDIRNGSVANKRLQGINPNLTGTADAYLPDFGFDVAVPCNKVASSSVMKTNITTTSATVSWGAAGPSTISYEYLLDQVPTHPTSSGYLYTTGTSLNFTNLTPGACYYIHIKTHCDPAKSLQYQDTSGWIIDSFCTLVDCVTPEVTIDRVTSTTAVASWPAVPTVLSYEYSVGVTPDPPTKGMTTIYTSVKLQGLTPNKPLYFYLKAYCSVVPESSWGTTPFHTSATLSVNELNTDAAILAAYPNPVTDVLKVQVNAADKNGAVITLHDITGKQIALYNVTGEQLEVNMTNIPSGIYLLKYNGAGLSDVMRINKQ